MQIDERTEALGKKCQDLLAIDSQFQFLGGKENLQLRLEIFVLKGINEKGNREMRRIKWYLRRKKFIHKKKKKRNFLNLE